MPPAGFEPTSSAGERPQTYALDRAAPGTGSPLINLTFLSQQNVPIFIWMTEHRLWNRNAESSALGLSYSWNFKKEVHTWIAKAYNDYECPKTVILKS
jgi:hypothetical protein